MATFDVIVKVGFLDAAERTSEVSYLLDTQFDDAANAGAGNMGDILTDVASLDIALNVLTMDHVDYEKVEIQVPGGGAAANVAANNQVTAFTRILTAGGNQGYFEVPAWDDVVYDQDSNNLLSAAYNAAASTVIGLIRDLPTGEAISQVQWSQSRTRKSRGKQLS